LGVRDLREYCSIVLGEIARAVNADNAIFRVQGTCPEKEILILHKISEAAAASFEKDPNAELLSKGKTIAFTLQDQTSALVAPIKEKESQVGFIAFFRSSDKRFFTSYEKRFLAIIDDIISPNIESLRLYNSLHLLYRNTVKALAAAIDAKDAYTHGHSFRVAKYALSIGRKMFLDADQLSDLEIAAYMHDLGKIGIPEAILGKAGRLTPQEFDEVKKHPIITDQILEAIDLPAHIVNGAVQHHERLDGRGYPHGLVGDAISLFGRIIAVADVFDALTTDRQYRGAMTVEASLTLLCEGIDTEYDKNIVLALVSALQDGDDIEMSKMYPALKFLKINQMNEFLGNLINILLSEKNSFPPSEPPPIQSRHIEGIGQR
jgi:HD-GYP domain-containing protein (c-di-GMP phosphodiesterase class II)